MVLVGALLWSTGGWFARAPVFDSVPPLVLPAMLAFWRVTFGAVVLAPTVRRPRFRWELLPMALCFALMNLTYVTALIRTTPANAIWLQNAAPWWVFLMSLFLFHQPVERRNLVPMILGMTGVALILLLEVTQSQDRSAVGLTAGVLSGIFYAAVLCFLRHLHTENASWLITVNQLTAAVLLLPWVIASGYVPTGPQILVLIAFGAFQLGIPYLLVARGLRSISAQEGTAIGLLEPVLLPLWAYLAWSVRIDWWTLLGASFILVGLFIRYVLWSDEPEPRTKIPDQAVLDEQNTQEAGFRN
jgi:drug/metabolite transporter (DMT)-like permease